MRKFLLSGLSAILATSVGCGDDDSSSSPIKFTVSIENISKIHDFPASGVFTTPMGETEPGPATPGKAYEFDFSATPGSYLSFATMFVNSNDLFFAPEEGGIAVFDRMGEPISGDITNQVMLWDAGTEMNEEPGAGANQPMMQAGPNTGAIDVDATVRLAADDFGNLPAVSDVVQVILTPRGGNRFTLRIANVSTATTLQFTGGESGVVMTPGPWVVHSASSPLFSVGQADFGDGLESLAEDGDPAIIVEALAARAGITGPIAPGAYAIHSGEFEALFTDGESDRGQGLEALAEDGDPTALMNSLAADSTISAHGVFAIPVGAAEPGPVIAGNRYEFTVSAQPGDRLSIATMLVQSNDLFFGFAPGGIALFDNAGIPISGMVSDSLQLWDTGTEENEFPGVGANQAPRQLGANTGTDENGVVRVVDDEFKYPSADRYVRVTITPM